MSEQAKPDLSYLPEGVEAYLRERGWEPLGRGECALEGDRGWVVYDGRIDVAFNNQGLPGWDATATNMRAGDQGQSYGVTVFFRRAKSWTAAVTYGSTEPEPDEISKAQAAYVEAAKQLAEAEAELRRAELALDDAAAKAVRCRILASAAQEAIGEAGGA